MTSRDESVEIMEEELVFEELEVPDSSAESFAGEMAAEISDDMLDGLDADDLPSETPQIVAEDELFDDEPLEIMDEELVFSDEETIPAVELPEEQDGFEDVPDEWPELAADGLERGLDDPLGDGLELISDEEISSLEQPSAEEMAEAVPESTEESGDAAPEIQDERVQGLSERTKEDVKRVLNYLDNLFDDLPEEKVKEFAQSEFYTVYNRLFDELGI